MNENLKLKFLHIFFPNKCPSCHKIIYYNDLFCSDCFKDLVLPKGERCKVCFSLKEKCDCNKNPKFYFRSISPFVYDKSVKNSLITLKRIKLDRLFEFYAEKMADMVNNKYKDVGFDAIIPVPMYKDKLKNRGYNQSELLAEKLSEKLNIPILKNVLTQKEEAKSQHTLSYKERLKNVKGIYRSGGIPIECQRVLLVDDIMTSGATLNECAKMIRLEGVTKIYCVTAAKSE